MRTRAGALLVTLAVVAMFLALAVAWQASIFLVHACVVLAAAGAATYGLSRSRSRSQRR